VDDPADLDEAIEVARRAVAAIDEPVRLGEDLVALTVDLYTRFEDRGDVADVEEAIAVGRRAAAEPADDATRAARLGRLTTSPLPRSCLMLLGWS
jgi:dienelactone hydrolase